MKTFKKNMARIRPLLHDSRHKADSGSSVLQETIRLLLTTLPRNAVACFQTTFQTPIFR